MSRPKIFRNANIRGKIIAEAVQALEHGVSPKTIASKHSIPYTTLAHWLRYNLDAYRARHSFIELNLAGYTGKRRDWHLNMRLSHLSLYRQLHGMPPNPTPRRKVKPEQTPLDTPSVDQRSRDCVIRVCHNSEQS